MTDRLLTDEENPYTRQEKRLQLQFNQGVFVNRAAMMEAHKEAEAFTEGSQKQDTKTLKAVGEWLEEWQKDAKITIWWTDLVGQLKQGKMPDGY